MSYILTFSPDSVPDEPAKYTVQYLSHYFPEQGLSKWHSYNSYNQAYVNDFDSLYNYCNMVKMIKYLYRLSAFSSVGAVTVQK